MAILGPGLFNTLIAITLALIPPFIRATYNAVHAEMQKEYIIASRLDGSPPQRIMRLAILPNIVETLVTQTTRTLSAAILDISAVGFLGLGAQSPQPEWGPCWPIRAILSIWPLDGDPARDGHPVQRAGDQPGGRRHSRSTQRGERLMLPALLSIPAPGRPERPGCALNGDVADAPARHTQPHHRNRHPQGKVKAVDRVSLTLNEGRSAGWWGNPARARAWWPR